MPNTSTAGARGAGARPGRASSGSWQRSASATVATDCQPPVATPQSGCCSASAQPVEPVLLLAGLVALGPRRPRRRRSSFAAGQK
jgi:MYXO-CTERM domain-containing protein